MLFWRVTILFNNPSFAHILARAVENVETRSTTSSGPLGTQNSLYREQDAASSLESWMNGRIC